MSSKKRKLASGGSKVEIVTRNFERVCLLCPAKIPPEKPDWQKLCFQCWKRSKDEKKSKKSAGTGEVVYRSCVVCDRLNIDHSSPLWMTKCRECFIASRRSDVPRMMRK